MIIITGAAGFIGSVLVGKLNNDGFDDLILVDEFSTPEKSDNLEGKKYSEKVDRNHLFEWLKENKQPIDFVLHIGARTNTAEFDWELLNTLNLDYTKKIWTYCTQNNIPMVYASSGATYGSGEHGYDDSDLSIFEKLEPLNPYGKSKNEFDKWALKQTTAPPFWYGLKFFNVYGPNEYHKARMASVIFHTYNQVKENGKMNLFRSHRPDFEDGMQLRDFVYVKDVVNVIRFLMNKKPQSGIYNLGTGHAESFLALANATFDAMGKERNISFIDIPEDIRDKYQYFTEAKMKKLRKAGYTENFYTLEEGVKDYVQNYLIPNKYL
ncbi:ADP-glyceromanno-heptose 6-epimerase [Bacteroidales bacterium OttesenSCG-928-C19]|nr:ADP-glyceromanno-heptose 6-epimerase [Bacteroidales bacterium OttesenSCG-928-C19]